MFVAVELIPPVKLAAIPKKIIEKQHKIAEITPCFTQDYLEKGKKELLYGLNKSNRAETTLPETPKNSLIDIYV